MAKFEDCLLRLEKIVQELEKGEVPLEKSLTLFEEGMRLSATCRKELEEAEGKVEILLKQNGKLQAEAFEPLRPANGDPTNQIRRVLLHALLYSPACSNRLWSKARR